MPIIIDGQEKHIFLFKDNHLNLIYNKLSQCENFKDFQFSLETYFTTDIYIIHDPWDLNKILNIYTVTLEDIICFFLILIIQRHIKCSHNNNFFTSKTSEKYKYLITDVYSSEDIYKGILEIRGELSTYNKSFIKYIWGLLGLHLMDIYMENENNDHSIEALHYMSLYINSVKEDNVMGIKSSSNKQIDPSSILFDEIYDASKLW
ncbi:hypothetical protein LY90DRAFT_517164 [Neocallimastix californiae]|uniref:Uncharacterized protein n=1 Tax=Neocallimastix californiae TaxID=1754190 RepID=A0A1Y2ACG4_9FUNG|nr:hypothetical protein LY90DRAFT_517164 [Neocallimastix californiae]|eukprot:ORY19960.1 hypothetical protein LY90DRAFT_517164 [Neocallimastix californiae]